MILGAAAALIAGAGALALVQPGDLGDEDTAAPVETTSTTAGVDLTTTTTVEVTTTESPVTTVPGATATTVAGAATSTTIAGSTATTVPGAETTTTIAGSGLGVAGPASGGTDGTAETGGESMLGAGLALAALGLLLRRAAHIRPV